MPEAEKTIVGPKKPRTAVSSVLWKSLNEPVIELTQKNTGKEKQN